MAQTGTAFKQVAPQLLVSYLDRARRFYTEALGFQEAAIHGEPPFYAILQRGNVPIHLRVGQPAHGEGNDHEQERHLEAYIEVENIEELFKDLRTRGVRIVRDLKEMAWGTKEFVIADPDGHFLCFAQPA